MDESTWILPSTVINHYLEFHIAQLYAFVSAMNTLSLYIKHTSRDNVINVPGCISGQKSSYFVWNCLDL